MNIKITLKQIIFFLLFIFLVWFFLFRTKELTVSYEGVEEVVEETASIEVMPSYARKTAAINQSFVADTALGVSNMMAEDSLMYDEKESDEEMVVPERYRENKYFRVDTEQFEDLVKNLTEEIEKLEGTIKINEQNSNKKIVYDKQFFPRFQNIEFTVDNDESKDLSKIETILKQYGDIRVSNSNKTSIEQELINYEQQLKEMEEARKALKDSKDKDWIARQDADLAKKSEHIKNQIENAKKQSTYKTYNINIYENIKFRINAIKYWYSNNYELKAAISSVLPEMVELLSKIIPITFMIIILMYAISSIFRDSKKKNFEQQLEMLKKHFDEKNINIDIKM